MRIPKGSGGRIISSRFLHRRRQNEKGAETKVKQITGQETIHGYKGELEEDKMERKQARWKDKKEEGLVQPGRVHYKLVAVSFIAVTDMSLGPAFGRLPLV